MTVTVGTGTNEVESPCSAPPPLRTSQSQRLDVEELSMMHNGGRCLLRRGRWTQTIQDVTVYLPYDLLAEPGPDVRIEVRLCPEVVYMRACGERCDSEWQKLPLTRSVLPDESSWFLLPGRGQEQGLDKGQGGWVVLLLRKAPPEEIYAGSEWWECVFEGDEKIDTLTCTVGADVSSLPLHALQRAEKEHARFMSLEAEEQQREQVALTDLKQVGERRGVDGHVLLYWEGVFNLVCDVTDLLHCP